MRDSAILLIHCPDRKGIVAAAANFLYNHNGNILHADQHQDAALGLFFMRVEWDLRGFDLDLADFAAGFEPIAREFRMQWRLERSRAEPRAAIFVSRYDHCLADLLYRHRSGELACAVSLVVSNHPDARDLAGFYGVAFHHIPVEPGNSEAAEAEQLRLLDAHGIDLVVLARYMQILSSAFVARYPQRIVNVHHSFLPAFSGPRPYHRAHARGVKLIGATSHSQKGRDLEKVVLARAVRWHALHRILVYANKTVVFD
ncbi:MAG: formyltetrahydrofolate deformylase [Nitrospirae bacterium]|nr:formyltetrahydrofolate deformylase [Nitrospirota bacterium]